MSATIATLEKVRAAASGILQRGQQPSASLVIGELGGGGKALVLEYLKTLREQGWLAEEARRAIICIAARQAVARPSELDGADIKAGSEVQEPIISQWIAETALRLAALELEVANLRQILISAALNPKQDLPYTSSVAAIVVTPALTPVRPLPRVPPRLPVYKKPAP